MKISTLYRLTYIYLSLALFIFILSWLDLGVGLVLGILFGTAFYKAYPLSDDEKLNLPPKGMLIILAICLIWCFCAGIGYFYYQSFDYHFRNAVFRDLINYKWPVFYDRANTPMVYYMAFWLVPSLFGKFFIAIGISKNLSFMFANVILFIYAVFGVFLLFLHIIKASKANNIRNILIVIIGFMFFSGLDIIGHKYFQIVKQPFEYHLDWWATFIQYSSHTTSMFWVFNQFIPVGLLILLVYNERNIKNFGFLIVLSLFFAPYPTASIGLFMIAYAISQMLKSKNKKDFLIENIFSISNIIGVFWLLPVVILYFITNSEGMYGYYYIFSYTTPFRLVLFYVLEFLLYVIVMLPRYKKDLFFNLSIVMLFLIPFLRLDQQNNFCMRASIPVMIIVALYAVRTLIDNKKDICKYALIILMLIGSATPIVEFYRGFHYVTEAKKINLVADDIYTLNQRLVVMPVFFWDANHQFTAQTYKTDFFWQFLAKKTRGLNY